MRNVFVFIRRTMWSAVFLTTLSAAAVLAVVDSPGLIVEDVTADSPGAKAGLQQGDRVLSYGGKALTSPAAFGAAQENNQGEKEWVLEVKRGEHTVKMTVPSGQLGLLVRPELSSNVTKLYEDGRMVKTGGSKDEAITKWQAAAKIVQDEGDNAAAEWLNWRSGALQEEQAHWQEASDLYFAALSLARQSDDMAGQCELLSALGRCSEKLGDSASAQKWFEQAQQADLTAECEIWLARDLDSAGRISRLRSDLPAVQNYYRRALAIRERLLPNSLAVVRSLINLGEVSYSREDLAAAQEYVSRALAILERLAPNSLVVARSLNDLGRVASSRGDLDAAREYRSRALAILERLAPNSIEVATSLNDLGYIALRMGDLASAQEYHSRALAIRERLAPNSLDVATSLNDLGNVALDRGDLAAAQDYHSRALAINERLAPNSLEVAKSLNYLGYFAASRGDLAAAQEYHSRALAIRERLLPNSLPVAESLTYLGDVALRKGDLAAAQEYHSRALAIREKLVPNSLDVATSLTYLGDVADRRGDLAAPREYHTRALAIREKLTPNSLDVATSLTYLGDVALRKGDLAAAREYHSRALAIRERSVPNSLDVATSLTYLGDVAGRRGDLAAAREYHSRALAIRERSVPNSLDVATSLYALGNTALNSGDLAAAQQYLSRALAIRERLAPNSIDVAGSLYDLGNVAFSREDLAAAQEYLGRALAITESVAPNSLNFARALTSLGKVAFSKGDLAAAKGYYSRALAVEEMLAPNSLDVAVSLNNLGGVALRERRLSDARLSFEHAVEITESERGHIPSAESRALLIAQYNSAYSRLLQTWLALDDVPSAFSTSERARARSLLDLIAEGRVDIRQGVDSNLLERERFLMQSLNDSADRQTRLLSGKHTEQEAAAAIKEIDSLTTECHEIEAQIRVSSPRYAALTQPQPLRLEEVQRQVLDPDSYLLEYALGEEKSFLFAVTQNSVEVYTLPKREEVETLARQTYESFTARNQFKPDESPQQRNLRILQADAEYPKLAARLSQMILAPAASQLRARRLLIIADGALLQIPFAALPDPSAGSSKALMEMHEIVSLPSASVIAAQRRELSGRKPASKQLALFADPVFDFDDERVKAITSSPDAKAKVFSASKNSAPIAPSSEQRQSQVEQALRDIGIASDRSKIQRLPFSREEAKSIFAFARRHDSLEALDFAANKDAATGSELGQYRIVHFATHALLNNRHPELSGIVLSLVNQQGRELDGFLRLNEIYNLNLSADLVVLSACETGLGQQIESEGLIGLTRGFLYAGAARVVASLWKVDDEATAELMRRFYEKLLQEHQPAAAALRQAQTEMSGQKRWSSAYYWAGFELQGEWR